MTQTSSSRNSLGISRKILRGVAAVTLAVYSWSFAFAGAAIAATHKEPDRWHGKKGLTPAQIAKKIADDAAKRKPQMPLFPYRQAAENSKHRHIKVVATKPLTLLDEVGRLAHPVAYREVAAWKTSLKEGKATGALASRLHLWLGEWELAKNEQPEQAIWHFDQAKKLSDKSQQVYGLASYDTATALFYEGAYVAAGRAFSKLENGKTALPGYDVHRAALWLRHAGACAGYHEDHARKGIPEPPRLDPLCGAAGLAAILRSLGRPWDEKTVLAAIHHTGEGSSFQDIIDGAQKLGLSGVSVSADDQGLMGLPKPVVAYVERDHFITVTRADKAGVSYLCSDCGPWPGGRVDLTWAQWHTMNPGLYVSVTKPKSQGQATVAELINPGSNVDIAQENDSLQSAVKFARSAVDPAIHPRTAEDQEVNAAGAFPDVRVAFAGPDRSLGQVLRPVVGSKLPAARPHVIFTGAIGNVQCGNSPVSGQCNCQTSCPTDGPGTVTSGGPGTGSSPTSPVNGTPIEAVAYGPSHGDPVNLATGEEEYSPEDDLTVYNPHGPSVAWQRIYDSLRGTGDGYPSTSNATYECADFGIGWSHTYNVCVYDPTNGSTGTTNLKYVIEPNGGRTYFTAPSAPNASVPKIQCTVQSGIPMLVEWDYSASSTTGYYTITYSDRTKYVTTTSNTAHCYQLAQITDRNGNSIYFNYASIPHSDWYLLNSISTGSGATGTILLSIVRAGDGTGNITQVNDCYGRSIYYHCDTYYNKNVGASWPQSYQELDHVSQIVPTCTLNPPDRYAYGYQLVSNLENQEQINFLHTVAVPSPTGTGASIATINYDPSTDFVSSIVDGNGNVRSYTSINQGGSLAIPSIYTKVTVADHLGNVAYSYIVSYDTNMSETSRTDGSGRVVSSKVFSDPNDSLQPSAALDGVASQSYPDVTIGRGGTGLITASGTMVPASGTWDIINSSGVIVVSSALPGSPAWNVVYNSSLNQLTITVPVNATVGNGYVVRYTGGHSATFDVVDTTSNSGVTNYTWDQYGNILTKTSARGIVTTYTYSYVNFALGELIQVQEGTKTSTLCTYDETHGGLISQIQMPTPGTVASTSRIAFSFQYDSLGNILQEVHPGNNTGTSKTSYMGYGSNPWIGRPSTATDPLGHIVTYTYDAQGNTTSKTDAVGNETDYGDTARLNGYNIANQSTLVTYPSTNQVPGGHSETASIYLYPGGPLLTTEIYDEGGNLVREINTAYGPEGEVLSNTGSTEPVGYTYDALYREQTLTDGNNNTTHFAYNSAGYIKSVSYPGAGGSTTGADTVNYTSYDANGNVLTRIDGNGSTTTYTYNDPGRKLTNIHYSNLPVGVSALYDVNLSYDNYGRLSSINNGVVGRSYGYISGGITYPGYDDENNPLNVVTSYFASDGVTILFSATSGYTYFADNTRQSMVTPAGTFSYLYNADGLLSSLTNPNGETTSWSFYNNNWLQGQTLSNGVNAVYTYNARGFLTDLDNANSASSSLSDFGTMTYSAVGDRLQMTANFGSTAPSSYSGTVYYGYDYGQTANPALNRSQLTQETSSTRAGGYTNNFAYDGGVGNAAGNPTTVRSTGSNTYNVNNQITSFVNASGASLGTFSYDGNGNPTTYKSGSLAFDPENRLTEYGAVFSAGYSAEGLRAWKNAGGTSTKVYYWYDGNNPVCELNASGGVVAVNTFGYNGLISRRTGTSTVFYTFDPQGNIAQRTDGSQTVLDSTIVDAFGARVSTGSSADPFNGFGAKFGYYSDSETGLLLLGHRYYDPVTGRFITRDPFGYAGGINLYDYTQNNPLTNSDPSGYFCLPQFGDCLKHHLLAGIIGCLGTAWLVPECRGILIAAAVTCTSWLSLGGLPGLLACLDLGLPWVARECGLPCIVGFAVGIADGVQACFEDANKPCCSGSGSGTGGSGGNGGDGSGGDGGGGGGGSGGGNGDGDGNGNGNGSYPGSITWS